MTKLALVALTVGIAGSALTVTSTTIYSSQFQCAYPIGGSIKTVLDPANIWSATVVPAPNQLQESVLVDIDGDLQMDTIHPGLRVVITDIQNWGSPSCQITDSSGIRWSLERTGIPGNTTNEVHLQTPIVLPVNSDLRVEWPQGASGGSRVTLLGRVVNI